MKPNLASEPDAKYPLTFPKFASSKLDGIRGLAQYNTCVTRSLKPIPNYRLRDLMAATQGLDGEFICGDPTASDVYHKTSSAVRTEDRHIDDITFYAFDILDRTLPYSERYERLCGMALPRHIKVLPQTLLKDQGDLASFYAEQLSLGFEGAILRNGPALYFEGRSTAKSQNMLKFKPFLDSDGIVVDVFEALTNNNPTFTNELGRTARSTHAENLEGNGMAGGFVIQMGQRIFNIAAGKLDHSARTEVWRNKHNYIGRIATFRHLPIGEKDVPRHGRFYRWKDLA